MDRDVRERGGIVTETIHRDPASVALEAAMRCFAPDGLGWTPGSTGWSGDVRGLPVAVSLLSWEHAQLPVVGADERGSAVDALGLLVELQQATWSMPAAEVVPANMLAVIAETGGAVLAAYDPRLGWTREGWLGFAIGMGSRSGALVSHMLGVRPEMRAGGLGWRLKVLQAHLALATGHRSMVWTFDPLRGASARLNLEKLGATVESLTIDKYGALRSDLYGAIPSDRFIAHWDLCAPRTHAQIASSLAGDPSRWPAATIAAIPILDHEHRDRLLASQPRRVRIGFPANIDLLARRDPMALFAWRRRLREALDSVITTTRARPASGTVPDPRDIAIETREGPYLVVGCATTGDGVSRENWYILERKDLG